MPLYYYEDEFYNDLEELHDEIASSEDYVGEEQLITIFENHIYQIDDMDDLIKYCDYDQFKVKEVLNDFGMEWLK